VSDSPHEALPQWAVNIVVWACLVLSAGFTGLLGWFLRKYSLKIELLEKNQKLFATMDSVARMQLQIAPLISRTEFLAHLQQMREDNDRRNEQMREDRLQMHKENRDDNAALRADVRAVHSRVDELFGK